MLFKADLKTKTTLHKVENRRRATEAEETARWAAQAVKQPGAFRPAGIKMWGRLRGCPWDPRLDPVSHGGRFSHWVTPREETVPTTFVSALWAEEADGATALGPTVEWKWDRFWLCWRIIFFFSKDSRKMGSTWVRLLSIHIQCPSQERRNCLWPDWPLMQPWMWFVSLLRRGSGPVSPCRFPFLSVMRLSVREICHGEVAPLLWVPEWGLRSPASHVVDT